VNEDGNPVPQGSEGEVTLGGPQCSRASMTADGVWEDLYGKRVRLGDLAVMDEDGFITVTGRLKDLIIRGGVNISPVELDNILSRHPDIVDAAACGVPDKVYGEEVICYVITRDGSGLTEEAVIAHCAHDLAPFKRPKRVIFTDALPRTERGKLDRKALTEAWKEASAVVA